MGGKALSVGDRLLLGLRDQVKTPKRQQPGGPRSQATHRSTTAIHRKSTPAYDGVSHTFVGALMERWAQGRALEASAGTPLP